MRFKVKFIHYVFSIGEVRARSVLRLGLARGENMTEHEKQTLTNYDYFQLKWNIKRHLEQELINITKQHVIY